MDLIARLQNAILEDAPSGDVTTSLFLNGHTDAQVSASIVAKQDGVFSGKEVISHMAALGKTPISAQCHVNDGATLSSGTRVASFSGHVSDILLIERVMLNLLQRLSGVATTTAHFVSALNNSAIHLLDTRKTTPLWRDLEKKAVVHGGGYNHRIGLSDMILIKENHLAAFLNAHSPHELGPYLKSIKTMHPGLKIEIEIESNEQLRNFDLSMVDYIMLDNYSIHDIKAACDVIASKRWTAEIEISGNVSLDTIAHYRDLPIHRISVGSLTHSVRALDLSLRF